MSTDLAERRKAELIEQFAHIQERIDQTDALSHPQITAIVSEIEHEFDEADRRHSDLEHAITQGATDDQLRRVYKPFVKQLDGIQQRLLDLQQALLYLEIHDQQQTVYADRLASVTTLCQELDAVLTHDVEYLPVIWDGYAAHAIQFQEFYAVHVPRDESSTLGAPFVAHELGHAVVDHLTQSDQQVFQNRLEEFVEEWPERKQSLVRRTWRDWFKELVCDACGVLTFGPAYVLATTERLCHNNPYQLPRPTVVQPHPPDALRFEFMDALASDVLPPALYDETCSACDAFEAHLRQTAAREPAEYQSWVDDRLFDGIRTAARNGVDSDLEPLCEAIRTDTAPSTVDGQQKRLEANHEWLNRQNGG